jgi:hypothetical protein
LDREEVEMIRKRWFLQTVSLIVSCCIIGECEHVRAQGGDIPEKLNDQWETAAPGTEQLDAKPIRNMLAAVVNEGAQSEGSGPVAADRYKNISSIVIVRNGRQSDPSVVRWEHDDAPRGLACHRQGACLRTYAQLSDVLDDPTQFVEAAFGHEYRYTVALQPPVQLTLSLQIAEGFSLHEELTRIPE